jgi:Ca-activated chloride channel family protein
MSIAEIALLRPLWLVTPPAILALAFAARAAGDLGDWRRAVDPHLMALLERRGAVLAGAARRARPSPWLVAAAIIAAALAGPAIERPDADSFRNLDGLVVALDTSRSVAEGGAFPEARLAAAEIVAAAGGRQAALVVFAGDAYLASAFTTDGAAIEPILASAGGDLVPDPGSRPARALGLADALFRDARMIGGDVVLVTDGGGVDGEAVAAAAALAGDGRRVHVLFVPAPARAAAAPEPDAAAAARLAAAGGGRYADVRDPAALVSAVAATRAERLGRAGYAAIAATDLGRFALALAALPLLLLFRRRP